MSTIRVLFVVGLMAAALFMATISMVLTAIPANAEHQSRCNIEILVGSTDPQDENDIFRPNILRVPVIIASDAVGILSDSLSGDTDLDCETIPHESEDEE